MMSELAVAIYRAKAARQAPYVINKPANLDAIAERDRLIEQLYRANEEQLEKIRNLRAAFTEKCDELEMLREECERRRYVPDSDNIAPMISELMSAVSRKFEVSIAKLIGDSREPQIVLPRHVLFYLARRLTTEALSDLGRAFHRDNATIIFGAGKIKKLRPTDPELDRKIAAIESALSPPEQTS